MILKSLMILHYGNFLMRFVIIYRRSLEMLEGITHPRLVSLTLLLHFIIFMTNRYITFAFFRSDGVVLRVSVLSLGFITAYIYL